MVSIERLSTGVKEFDELIEGGIPRGFFVAVTGEPGTGKTIFCIHFINEGIKVGDKCIYVTTEESKESIIRQAAQFGFNFERAVEERKLVLIDALMGKDEQWSLKSLELDELVEKIIEGKKFLGFGRSRVVVDSLSAFWLDKPAMARRYSYYLKKVLSKWDFTILVTSQYAITTSSAFGWGVEHVSDGIIRFRRGIKDGVLKRYVIVEKMRQTQHSLQLHEINIENGRGLFIVRTTEERREDYALPKKVSEKIKRAEQEKENALP